MSIFQLSVIVIIALFVSMLLKQYSKSEYALIIQIVVGIFIVLAVAVKISQIISDITALSGGIGLNITQIKLLVKVLGICVITQFVCEICRDSGENALASQLEFAGKVIVVALMLPMLESIINLVAGIIT